LSVIYALFKLIFRGIIVFVSKAFVFAFEKVIGQKLAKVIELTV